jgi:hypothetical protein
MRSSLSRLRSKLLPQSRYHDWVLEVERTVESTPYSSCRLGRSVVSAIDVAGSGL